jgi:hypothetical protein
MSEKTDVMITPQRRRPTGAPPPLPHPVSVTTRAWLVLAVVVLAGGIVISVRAPSLRRPGVTGFKPGDEVYGACHGSFAP